MRKMQVPAYWLAPEGVHAIEKMEVDVDSKKVMTMEDAGMAMLLASLGIGLVLVTGVADELVVGREAVAGISDTFMLY